MNHRTMVSMAALGSTLGLALPSAVPAAPVTLFDQAPESWTTVAPGVVLVDFGRVAFGNGDYQQVGGQVAASESTSRIASRDDERRKRLSSLR